MKNELYKKIMIATDGSENAKKAATSGIEIAKLAGAELYIVHVIPKVPNLSYFGIPIESPRKIPIEEQTFIKNLEEEGMEILKIIQKMADEKGVNAEILLLEGHPGSEIIDFADKNDVDLIVMGTLGRTGLNRIIIGSVAVDVVRHANKMVLVVK